MYFPNPADPNAGPTPQITDDPHRTGQNLAFLDGHGEFVHWEDQRAKTFGLEVLEGGTWTGDGYEAKVNGYATVARLGRVRQY